MKKRKKSAQKQKVYANYEKSIYKREELCYSIEEAVEFAGFQPAW